MYSRQDSNLHAFRHWFLRPARLPIPPREHLYLKWDSNPHVFQHWCLRPARLPIPPFRHLYKQWDSNPRHLVPKTNASGHWAMLAFLYLQRNSNPHALKRGFLRPLCLCPISPWRHLYPIGDSNPYAFRPTHLKRRCLPVPTTGHLRRRWDSNPHADSTPTNSLANCCSTIMTYISFLKNVFAEIEGLEPTSRLITDTAVFKTAALPIRLYFHFAENVRFELTGPVYQTSGFRDRCNEPLYQFSVAVKVRFELTVPVRAHRLSRSAL